jgi:hypothetical protein
MKTHREKQQERALEAQNILFKILRLDEFTYNELVFETAFKHIESSEIYSDEVKEIMPKSKFFWSWWKNEYSIIDWLYIGFFTPEHYSLSINQLLATYKEMHCSADPYLDNYLIEKIMKEANSESGLILKN